MSKDKKLVGQCIRFKEGEVGRLSTFNDGSTEWEAIVDEDVNNYVKTSEKVIEHVNNFKEDEEDIDPIESAILDSEIKSNVNQLLPLETFEDKDTLEAYGKTKGVDLNKRYSIPNMYKALEAHVETD